MAPPPPPTPPFRLPLLPLPWLVLLGVLYPTQFGAPIPWRAPLRMPVAAVVPADACGGAVLRVAAGHGTNRRQFARRRWWALVDRGGCAFNEKALNAQAAGAAGMILVNHDSEPLGPMGADDVRGPQGAPAASPGTLRCASTAPLARPPWASPEALFTCALWSPLSACALVCCRRKRRLVSSFPPCW